MSVRSRFYDDSGGDRTYDSAALAQVLRGLVGDGVVAGIGNELAVADSVPAAMSVRVDTGAAFVRGYYLEVYSSAETLAIAAADPANPRIDRVVVRRDLAGRTGALAVLTGTPAGSPTAPALTQLEAGTWEIPLARIAVAAGATSIATANITDERGARAPSRGVAAAHASSHVPTTGSDPLATAAAGASAVGDGAAAGTAGSFARSDHRHAREAFAAPVASAPGDTQGAGAASTVARSDHRHARESFATPAIVLGAAPAAGAAGTPIRSDATIEAFDATVPVNQAVGDAAATGAASRAARRDHRHGMPAFGAAQAQTAYGQAAADGTALTIARSDHRHGTPGAPTPASVGSPDARITPNTSGSFKIYVGTSTPTSPADGDVWVKG
ncbi:MAG TPA: hypothetical protein VM305_02000 [Candidatus Limnocylindrales bacterium]|nr:hypothetical protein [Candidatus Limnocylindrales bacterium]